MKVKIAGSDPTFINMLDCQIQISVAFLLLNKDGGEIVVFLAMVMCLNFPYVFVPKSYELSLQEMFRAILMLKLVSQNGKESHFCFSCVSLCCTCEPDPSFGPEAHYHHFELQQRRCFLMSYSPANDVFCFFFVCQIKNSINPKSFSTLKSNLSLKFFCSKTFNDLLKTRHLHDYKLERLHWMIIRY